MQNNPSSINESTSEEILKNSVHNSKNVEEAVKAVSEKGAISLWESTYNDQIHPEYIWFDSGEVGEKAYAEFQRLLEAIKNRTDEWYVVGPALKELTGVDLEPGNLKWIFKDKEWGIKPEVLLSDVQSTLAQEEDDDFYDAQRAHFSQKP